MNYSEDHIALAAEYALGTLNAEERALVETMMIVDHGFKEVVEAWDRKLSPLHQMVVPIEPPAHLWGNISAVLGLGKTEAAPPVEEPQPESPPVQEAPVAAAAPVSPVPGEASPGEPEAVVDTPVTVTSADQFDYTRLPSPPENVAPVATGSDVADAEQAARGLLRTLRRPAIPARPNSLLNWTLRTSPTPHRLSRSARAAANLSSDGL